jgi:hypothetical protein
MELIQNFKRHIKRKKLKIKIKKIKKKIKNKQLKNQSFIILCKIKRKIQLNKTNLIKNIIHQI